MDRREERRGRGAVGDEAAVRGGRQEGEQERDQREAAAVLPARRHCRCGVVNQDLVGSLPPLVRRTGARSFIRPALPDLLRPMGM